MANAVGLRILVAGGGTAGHVYPGLALAAVLRSRGHDVSFAGTSSGPEAALVAAAGFPFLEVGARPLARGLSTAAVRAPLSAVAAARRARQLLRSADVAVGMGGYVSVPVILAAWREGIPLLLHEQNAVPGMANQRLWRLARGVALSFREAGPFFPRRARLVLTGNPVRDAILRVRADREALAKEGRVELDLDESRRTVVVFGGSQGALHIDRAATEACRVLADRGDIQVVLLTGPAHLERVRAELPRSADLVVRPIGYLGRMELAYACADLVVGRAGATTIAEITVCGLPAVLVPYPYATRRHQEANARAMQRMGGATIVLDEQLSGDVLADRIASLLAVPEGLASMAARSRAFGHPDAGERLADAVERVGGAA